MHKIKIGFLFFLLCGLLSLIGEQTKAQVSQIPPSEMPQGENVTASISLSSNYEYGGNSGEGFTTLKGIYSQEGTDRFPALYTMKIWSPPEGDEISLIFHKHVVVDIGFSIYYVVTTDGHMYRVTLSGDKYGMSVGSSKEVTFPPTTKISKIQGDDLYVVTGEGLVYASRDSATTWHIDTAGLGSVTLTSVALDSSQNVYVSSYSGMFRQGLTEQVWHSIPTGPNAAMYLFTSRKDNIYAATFSGLMISTDRGSSWQFDSAGIGYQTVTVLTDDTDGTLYAITATFGSNRVFMQKPGEPWQAMDHVLAGFSEDPTVNYLNDISVDSGIHVATSFGLLNSYDGGATWTPLTQGVPASNVYDFYEFPNGRRVMTTSLGLFTKNPSDTIWTKRFPVQSYLSGVKFFLDNAGTMYALGASTSINFPQNARSIWTSTDQGNSWTPDTIGLMDLPQGIQFVDEIGTEHLAASGNDGLLHLYSKSSGGIWEGDSAGFTAKSGETASIFISDHHGWVYLATNNSSASRILKRPVAGGSWAEVALDPSINVPYTFAITKDGKLVGGNNNTPVGYYDGTSWTIIPNPPGLNNPSGYPETVDSSGRLWVIYGNVDQNYNYTPYGTYWTSDLGQHWTQAADGSYNFSSLVSFGDTTYGLNSGNGLFYMVPGSAGVSSNVEGGIEFSLFPNPSNSGVALSITNAASSKVEIYDVLGNLVTSFNGSDHAFWDGTTNGASVASEIYVVRVTGKDKHGNPFVASKQVVIQR